MLSGVGKVSVSDTSLSSSVHDTLYPANKVRNVRIDSRPSLFSTTYSETDNSGSVIHLVLVQHQRTTGISRARVPIFLASGAKLRLYQSHVQVFILVGAFFEIDPSYGHCQFHVAAQICNVSNSIMSVVLTSAIKSTCFCSTPPGQFQKWVAHDGCSQETYRLYESWKCISPFIFKRYV